MSDFAPPRRDTRQPPPLSAALDQSTQVKTKVEECAVELSAVNAVLKQNLAQGVQLKEIEAKVQACAEELGAVNHTITQEIGKRKDLERKLSESDAALSESKLLHDKTRHLALYDPVTDLPNLTLFSDRLRLALVQMQRHASRLAVMFMDLDGFKAINDTHGHNVGDLALQLVARRLRSLVRGGDTVSRRGGDEFLFMALDAKDEADVEKLADRIISTVAEPFEVAGIRLSLRISVGIALYPGDGQSEHELLANADTAMYAAKKQAKGYLLYRQVAGP